LIKALYPACIAVLYAFTKDINEIVSQFYIFIYTFFSSIEQMFCRFGRKPQHGLCPHAYQPAYSAGLAEIEQDWNSLKKG